MSTTLEFCLPNETELILKSMKSEKHKAMILLMLDAGLRVSEMTNLDWLDLDFRRKVINVKSLKKREKDKVVRSIPMSSRVYDAFADYVQKKGKQKGFVFATESGTAPTRQTVNYLLRKIESENPEIERLYPHKLRHTFATGLRANGAELEDIRDMLGHEKLETSLIYAHVDPEKLRAIINKAQPKKSLWDRFKGWATPKKQNKISIITSDPRLLIGRDYEVKQIEKLIEKEVSILITGPVGIGKTHLINNLKFSRTILEIDDCKDFKKSIASIILHLFGGDKEQAAQLIFSSSDRSTLELKMSKHSLPNLCELLKQITTKNEYILKIADLDQVTPGTVKALQILKEHFIVITTARNIKIENTPFCWDFEKIELKPLKREESLRLFHRLTDSYQIEDIEFVRNKVHDTAEGNPRAIFELSQRITKEPYINGKIVEEIANNYLGKVVKEIDMSIYLLFLFIAGFAFMKVRGREMGEEGWRTISGGIMIILLFARYFFSKTRRRTI